MLPDVKTTSKIEVNKFFMIVCFCDFYIDNAILRIKTIKLV